MAFWHYHLLLIDEYCLPSTADAKESQRRLNILNIFTSILGRTRQEWQLWTICCLLYAIAMCVGGRDNHLESFQVFIYFKKALQFNLAGRRGRLERVLENKKARRWDCLPMLGIIQDVWRWVDSWMWKQRDIPNGWKDESNKNECSMTEYGRMKDVLNRYIKGRKSH